MKILSLLSVLLISSSSFAAINELADYNLTLKFLTESPGYTLAFDNASRSKSVSLQPNIVGNVGFAFSFKDVLGYGVGFSLTTRGIQNEGEKYRKGSSDYTDFRFILPFNKFLVSLHHSNYKGFYVDNSQDIDPTINSSTSLIQLPNLTLASTGASIIYVHKPDSYSIEGALDQTVRQEVSGGSWLFGASFSNMIFDNSGAAIIPAQVQGQYGEDSTITYGRFLNFNLSVGYGYTYCFTPTAFISAAAWAGAGWHFGSYRDLSSEKKGQDSSSKFTILVTTGSNGDRLLYGLNIGGDTDTFETNSLSISAGLWFVRAYVGTRF